MTQIQSMFYDVYMLCICISHVLLQAVESPVLLDKFNMKSKLTLFTFIDACFSHIVNDFKRGGVFFD